MRKPTFREIKKVLTSKGYPVFGGRDFDVTMGGIRTNIGGPTGQSSQARDDFNDWIWMRWEEHGREQFLIVPATTDPGLRSLKSPSNPAGSAIMVPDFYRGLWTKGRHSRMSNAFRQKANVTVWRDRDRDNYLDMGPNVPKQTGWFAINCHPASYRPGGSSSKIGPWGEGCQVTQSFNDFAKLRDVRDEQGRRYGTYDTSYSLITEADF
jgi:hypothetical protein